MPHGFGYSDPAMEETLYDIPRWCPFAGLDAFEDTIRPSTADAKGLGNKVKPSIIRH